MFESGREGRKGAFAGFSAGGRAQQEFREGLFFGADVVRFFTKGWRFDLQVFKAQRAVFEHFGFGKIFQSGAERVVP